MKLEKTRGEIETRDAPPEDNKSEPSSSGIDRRSPSDGPSNDGKTEAERD